MMLKEALIITFEEPKERDKERELTKIRNQISSDFKETKGSAKTDYSVLGAEMINACLDDPEKAVAFSLLFSFSIAEFDKANDINSAVSRRLLEIKEVLGEDLCIWCSKNYNDLQSLTSLLDSFVNSYENAQQRKNKITKLIHELAANNHQARVLSLISAWETQDGADKLAELFDSNKITYVRDLGRLLTITIDETVNQPLIRFLQWLREDKQAVLLSDLHNLSKKTRDEEIIRKRANGGTLEHISSDYAITHEGVRQIEKKFQSRFDRYIMKTNPHYILSAFSKNTGYISADDISGLLGNLSDIFIYSLKKSNCPSAHWSNELNGFIIGDGKWYKRLKECKEDLPAMLAVESVDGLVMNIIHDLIKPITFDVAKTLILSDYYQSGNVYLKKRLSLSQMYFTVLEKYYPDGIKLYDEAEAILFRNYVIKIFGDVHLPKNNRAIDVRLSELTILCDKAKRILPCGIRVSGELLPKIHDVIIKSDSQEIRYGELFERFKNELLEKSNITNKYFLQGVLKHYYAQDFEFTRYTLKKNKI